MERMKEMTKCVNVYKDVCYVVLINCLYLINTRIVRIYSILTGVKYVNNSHDTNCFSRIDGHNYNLRRAINFFQISKKGKITKKKNVNQNMIKL